MSRQNGTDNLSASLLTFDLENLYSTGAIMPCGCGSQITDDDMHDELPSEADMARFGHDAEVTTTCTECGREIYDDCEICPNCAAFQTNSPDNQTCAAASSSTNSISKALYPIAAVLLIVALVFMFIL